MSSDSPPDLGQRLGGIDVAETLEDQRVRARVKERLFGKVEESVKVDRFTLLDRLGHGAMGVVYSAFDPELDRRVALKFVRVEGGGKGSEDQRRRLMDEARSAAKLTHPNVLSIYDVGESGDRVFIAMEYVDGETLADWLRAEDRSWRDVLDVFVQAGRGLQAAHAVGLVHRDFKPANVLMGADATGVTHVRVADFGLALSVDEEAAERAGTPAYMAPEQHRGESVGVRADQFAFCVALWEGLYGVRPFEDTRDPSAPEPPASRAKSVPDYLRLACQRGLSANPDDRFNDMESLIACLLDDPSVRRRRWITRGLLVGFGALVAVTSVSLSSENKEVCPVDDSGLVGVWDDTRKRRIATAFERSGAAYWKTSWDTVEVALDEYTGSITAGRKDACEATHVRKQQSAALLDRRVACLDSRLRQVSALTDALAAADKKVVEKAVTATGRLPSVDVCSDVDVLQRPMRLPSVAVQAKVDEQYKSLAEASTLRNLGRFAEASKRAAAVEKQARALGYAPLVARALFVKGSADTERGEHKEARKALEGAVVASVAGRDDATLVDATTRLVFTVGYWLRDGDDAQRWSDLAEGALDAMGRPPESVSVLRDYQGATASVQGKRDIALKRSQESLALLEGRFGADDHRLARALTNLGNAMYGARKLKEAESLFERALVVFRKHYGKQHPRVAYVMSNLGAVQSASGNNEKALETLRAALQLKEKTLGDAHPSTAKTVSHLADVLAYLERYPESVGYSRRAVDLISKRLGKDHPMLITYFVNMGMTYVEMQDHANVHTSAERALTLLRKNKKQPRKDPRYLGAVALRGRARLALGKLGEAHSDLELAVSLYDPKTHYPDEIGHARFGLARVLIGLNRDRARAIGLAKAARADFVKAKNTQRVAHIDKWIASPGIKSR